MVLNSVASSEASSVLPELDESATDLMLCDGTFLVDELGLSRLLS